MKIDLNGSWQGKCFSGNGEPVFSFLGTVPGCVHTDLMGDKIPADLYYRDNTDQCQWIEDRDWEYTKTFSAHKAGHARLVFDGLDTYADICLNGRPVGSADNMFISHSFDVTDLLSEGENTVSVYFHSPIRKVATLEKRRGAFATERMHTRRIQCTYGWDWVARFVTCGIWRDVYIDLTDGFAVKNAYIYTESISEDSAQIVVEAEFENYQSGGFAEMEILDPDGKSVYRHRWFRKEAFLKEYIDLPGAKLWYPAGYGEQPLYTLRLSGKEYRFGIRAVRIQQLPDEKGSPYYQKCLEIKDSISGKIYDRNEDFSGFLLYINQCPIMCKGANWVPCEPFPSAEENSKITTLLSLAKEAGVNMLRVWGGGFFEKQHFYEECDRLGILVTQDFLMACGQYPDEKEEFIHQLKKETEFAALTLRNHPSLVWWSGDNENAILGYDEAETYKGRAAIHQGIFPVLNRLDPKRRFLLSSPCGGTPYASKTVGTTHNTQYLGESIFPYILQSDMTDYKEHFAQYLARFIAEEPTSGAISLPSLRRFMTESDIFDSEEMWQYHTKSNPDLSFTLFDVLLCFSRKVLGDFTDSADRYFKLKYNQFEWIRVSMENIRRNRGFVNGIVYWMWDDCWPAASGWSFVDYYGLPKAAYYSFKRCAGELLVSIDKKEAYEIYLCNDGLSSKDVSLSLSYVHNGKMVPIQTVTATVATGSERVTSLPLWVMPSDAILICDAKCGDLSDRAFYKAGKLPIIPCDALSVVSRTENSITVTASAYVHAVELEGEYIFDDDYFSLLPGEERTVTFRPSEKAESDGITVTGYTISEKQ